MIGSHREQAQFGRAKWRKRVLLPCWNAQIPLLLGMMGVFSYRLSNTINTFQDEETKGQVPMVEFVWESANIIFSLASLAIVLVQIAKFIAEALTPLGVLFGNIISLVLGSVILALDVVVYVQHADKQYSIMGIAMDCLLLFFTIIPTIYSIIVYRRLLAYDDYHLPHNVKHYGFNREADTSYKGPVIRMSFERSASKDRENPSGSTRSRRSSFTPSISIRRSGSTTNVEAPEPRPDLQRQASYDHRRSTQFDEYVSRRLSQLVKDDADRGMANVGLEGSRQESVYSVNLGVATDVPINRPRGNSFGRQPSWDASVNPNTSASSSTVQIGHSLNAVPEKPEEVKHAHHGAQYSAGSSSEDRLALLQTGDKNDRRVSGNSMVSYDNDPGSLGPAQRTASWGEGK